jgi:hypothetical protein
VVKERIWAAFFSEGHMADIVLVHGIAHELDSADTIEKEWVPALAGGVRTAGFGGRRIGCGASGR